MECLKTYFKKGFKADDSRLSIVYIIDSVLKWEKKHFQNNYTPHIRAWSPELFKIAAKAEEGMDRAKLEKTLRIWEEKNLMESEFINKLRRKMEEAEEEASGTMSTGEMDDILKELEHIRDATKQKAQREVKAPPRPSPPSQQSTFSSKLKKVKVQQTNATTRRFAPYQRKPQAPPPKPQEPESRPAGNLLSQLQHQLASINESQSSKPAAQAPRPPPPRRNANAAPQPPPQNFNGLLHSTRHQPTQPSNTDLNSQIMPAAQPPPPPRYESQQRSFPAQAPSQFSSDKSSLQTNYRQPPPPPAPPSGFSPYVPPVPPPPPSRGRGFHNARSRGRGYHGGPSFSSRGRGFDPRRRRFQPSPRGGFENHRGRGGFQPSPRGGFENHRGRGGFNNRGRGFNYRGRGFDNSRGRGRGFNQRRDFSEPGHLTRMMSTGGRCF